MLHRSLRRNAHKLFGAEMSAQSTSKMVSKAVDLLSKVISCRSMPDNKGPPGIQTGITHGNESEYFKMRKTFFI